MSSRENACRENGESYFTKKIDEQTVLYQQTRGEIHLAVVSPSPFITESSSQSTDPLRTDGSLAKPGSNFDTDDVDDDEEAGIMINTDRNPMISSPTIPKSTIAALCVCMMAHSYLLISVFPYSGYMAVNLVSKLNEDTAGSYAGILASSLMVGRATTAYAWGKLADQYGRTTVLCLSLSMASILSLAFGFAPSFIWAVIFRFCLGMSNGILGTLRTTVSEIAKGDEKLESRSMMIVMGMWSWGMLISPAISGLLSDPLRQYPDSKIWRIGSTSATTDDNHQNWAKITLGHYPFSLPNLLGSIFCLVAFWLVILFVEETLPSHEHRSAWQMLGRSLDNFLSTSCRISKTPYHLLGKPSKTIQHGDFSRSQIEKQDENDDEDDATNTVEDCTDSSSEWGAELVCIKEEVQEGNECFSRQDDAKAKATMFSILARTETRAYLLMYWAASFVSVSFNEIFPLFCMSRVAGLALDERHIGQIMSLCGLIFAISQYGAQSLAYSRFGLIGSIRLGALLGAPMIFLIPISLRLNEGTETGHLCWQTIMFLAVVLAINRICVMVFYSNIAVAMNRSVPPDHRATAQGVCGMGENIAKGLGPPFAGFLTTFSGRLLRRHGSFMTFGVVGAIGIMLALCTVFFINEVKSSEPSESTSNKYLARSEQEATDGRVEDEQ